MSTWIIQRERFISEYTFVIDTLGIDGRWYIATNNPAKFTKKPKKMQLIGAGSHAYAERTKK